MRIVDLEKLEARFEDEDARPLDDRFADALGVGLRPLRLLRDAIEADLDETNHGIGWWAGFGDLKHRVLVSDHLHQCAISVETNLVEAQLHVLELLAWWDRSSDFLRAGTVLSEPPYFRHPARTCARHDLPGRMVELHIAGAARAVGSALDCLAAVIIGVLPLPMNILTADFDRVCSDLKKLAKGDDSPERTIQSGFVTVFDSSIASAGPVGWDRWIMNFRNMLVHRGRRLGTSILAPRSGLLDASGKPIVRAEDIRLLPAEPDLSEIESWAGIETRSPFLCESAEVTMKRVLGSATKLVADVVEPLLTVWKARRAAPGLLPQPKNQWKDAPRRPSNFSGYDPGRIKADFNVLLGSPALVRRLKVAALDAKSRQKWK